MGSPRQASYVDYQARAREFEVGSKVYTLLGGTPANGGVVVAVWPAIGMVDVQFPHGTTRYPVEDLNIVDPTVGQTPARVTESVPGGQGTVPVSGGPLPGGPRPHVPNYNPPNISPMEAAVRAPVVPKTATPVPVAPTPKVAASEPPAPQARRVMAAYLKKAVYWASSNRKYKRTKEECDSGKLCCPRCEDAYLRNVVYKREEGKSVRLLCCPECMFLLRRDDILGMEE